MSGYSPGMGFQPCGPKALQVATRASQPRLAASKTMIDTQGINISFSLIVQIHAHISHQVHERSINMIRVGHTDASTEPQEEQSGVQRVQEEAHQGESRSASRGH
jgi:hypothetical protein